MMKKIINIVVVLATCLALVCSGAYSSAATSSDRRAKIGVKLFRSMLAADLDIKDKKGADGALTLLVVYTDSGDLEAAEELGELLLKSRTPGKPLLIKNITVKVRYTNDTSFGEHEKTTYAGIFVAGSIKGNALRQIVEYGTKQHIIVYSPFEGDVEKGVLGGLIIEARVMPYVNVETMNASGVRLKPFFMKVAKKYE